ncbi:MAG: NAD(P)/FAD-dependent oxidoreductase [Lachnospiraceae bacterium]|nr:NAD(P)/FAD-dependent oxidoreductase [Lachnospiraceae bacterium]
MYDVVIIGAGVTGSSVARELSRYQLKVAVLEKEPDVCEGTSKANSGIVHAGFDAVPGSLKAKLNVIGNKRMEALSKQLDFPFRKNGSLIICTEEEGKPTLEKLLKQGVENGVEGLKIISGDEARKMEPALSGDVLYALYAPSGGIVCPFGLTIALAENACVNGVDFFFDSPVKNITKGEAGYLVETPEKTFEAKAVVNAAGVYADVLHHMVSKTPLKIIARRGEYSLYDKQLGKMVDHTIFQLPSKLGKGVLVTPTVHGNLLLGPTAEDIEDKEDTATTAKGLALVQTKAAESVDKMPSGRMMITCFAGLRAHEVNDDFVIKELEDAENFFDVAGIESPGLTCAPAIGEYVAEMVLKKVPAEKKDNFLETREGIKHIADLSFEERKELIKKNPAYAVVVCRCETVTEGEIIDAIRRPLGAKTLDGIKRRTRAGMGRCQAGFCTPKTMELIANEWNMPLEEVVKSGRCSHVL